MVNREKKSINNYNNNVNNIKVSRKAGSITDSIIFHIHISNKKFDAKLPKGRDPRECWSVNSEKKQHMST